MGEEAGSVGREPGDELRPRVRTGLGQRDRIQDVVEHRIDEVVLAPDVRVEGRRLDSERLGEVAHRERRPAFLIEDPHGLADDGLAVETAMPLLAPGSTFRGVLGIDAIACHG